MVSSRSLMGIQGNEKKILLTTLRREWKGGADKPIFYELREPPREPDKLVLLLGRP
jgi:hypothetical protein